MRAIVFPQYLSALVLCLFYGCAQTEETPSQATTYQLTPSFNQSFVLGVRDGIDYTNEDSVFSFVFSSLPDEVYVFPTENYYYFQFYSQGVSFWGNFRLGVLDRDSGIAHFIYWEYLEDPQGPDDGRSWKKELGPESDVRIEKISDLRYSMTHRGKTVFFQLNEIDQKPPQLFSLPPDETFVSRLFDESGFQFFLLHRKSFNHFMFVLNEEEGFPGLRDTVTSENGTLIVDRLSRFVFFLDTAVDNRKILCGVWRTNTRRNNYWDGPFDQLADNYVTPQFSELVQEVYPYTKGRIDSYGIFTDKDASRLAISPYYEYDSMEEMLETLSECKEQPSEEFLPCMTYDYKTSF